MSFAYTPYKFRLARGEAAWHTMDVRALLVMSNTTADTDQDAATLSAISNLDEYNGSGDARAALGSEAVVQDDANNRSEMDAADITFGATVAAGTRQAVGIVIYQHVDGTAANDKPMLYIDSGGFPFDGANGPVNVTWHSEGIAQVT
jgi:hypothetical protein